MHRLFLLPGLPGCSGLCYNTVKSIQEIKREMITILIVGNNIADNERIAGGIIGGTELTTCVICTHTAPEALKVIESRRYKIDLFVISIKMKEQSGYRLAEKIRKLAEYRDCPILFVTNSSYSLSGFSELTTFQSYKKIQLHFPAHHPDRRTGQAGFVSGRHYTKPIGKA